ncbi:MAG: hypothetical protein HWE23_13580 [Rhodobacteraceae bacterium]|nr:hypothetical protein [Paracoccaceae bacterium]
MLFALFSLFLGFSTHQADAQTWEPVDLQVLPADGYGRIVLTFKDRTLLPHYDAVTTGGVLRISFQEPVDIKVDDVPLELPNYISIARRDPDGSAIRFALKDAFKINTLEAGEKLFIDILPKNWQGLPPGLPDDVVRDLAKRAEEAMRKIRALEQARLKSEDGPEVKLRMGEHPTFTRLVFEWSIRFDTAFVREDDIIRVTFNHPAQLDVSDLRAHLPEGVIDATSFLDKGKLKFLMRIDPTADIRAFREGQTYVIDVTPKRDAPLAPENQHIRDQLNIGSGDGISGVVDAPGVRPEDVPQAAPAPPAPVPAAPTPVPVQPGINDMIRQDQSQMQTPGEVGYTQAQQETIAYALEPVEFAAAPTPAPMSTVGEGASQAEDPSVEAPAVQGIDQSSAVRAPDTNYDAIDIPIIDTSQAPAIDPNAPADYVGETVAMLPRSKPVSDPLMLDSAFHQGDDLDRIQLAGSGEAIASVSSGAAIGDGAPDSISDLLTRSEATEIVDSQEVTSDSPVELTSTEVLDEEMVVAQASPDDDITTQTATQNIEVAQVMSDPEPGLGDVAGMTESLPMVDAPTDAAMSAPDEVIAPAAGELPPPMVLEGNESSSTLSSDEAWRAKGGSMDRVEIKNSPEKPPAELAESAKNFISAEARRIGNTVRIVFPFQEPTSSAVFRRNDSIWMVFDTPASIDTRGMLSALAETAENIEIQQGAGYQVLRLDLNDPMLATVGLDGNFWSLVIGDMIVEPSIPLKMERTVRADGGSVLRVLYRDPQNIREITDPFVGDQISLVTGFGPPRGLLKRQTFVDLEALSSAQGIAIAKKSDGVTVQLLGDDVLIEKIGGLSLSNRDVTRIRSSLNNLADPDTPDFIEFVALSTDDPKNYRDQLHLLQDRLSETPEGNRRKPLMDLAGFYLAHQFAQEAIGLMHLAVEEDPALVESSSFNLMMGAAQTLAGRPEEAYPYLNRPDLKSNPDAAIWQTIVDVGLGNWTQARISMPRGRAVVGTYPVSIQADFNLAAAQAMVEANDFGMANTILAEIEPSEVSPTQAARYDILRGRVADASGRSQEALRAFDLVAKSDNRPQAAEAVYRSLRIRFRDGELSAEETINALGGLATSWRGDEIELKTLRFLAQLQAEQGNYREAFESMQSALQVDPGADTTRLLQEEMNALFLSLFLDGKANEMSPIKALALYYDFREMTPVGRQGDDMVRNLAKTLIEVDLLDQAAELLRHQVDNRLKGAARAQIAADLGAIYLSDRKPEEALRVLNKSRQASLPDGIERQRNIVEARALTASGRPDLALELVRNMRGGDVDRLRADTFWAAQSWREAGEQLEGMYGSRWSDNIPLDELERRDILRAGIAYSLAGDQLSLKRLQTKYADKMSDSPESFAFEVVTRPIEAQGVEFLEIANQLAASDELETFLEEYRRQYMTPEGASGSGS